MSEQGDNLSAVEKVQLRERLLKVQQLEGKLVDRKAAVAHVQSLAGEFRDEMSLLPGRVATSLAQTFGIDEVEVQAAVDQEVRKSLEALAGLRIDVPG